MTEAEQRAAKDLILRMARAGGLQVSVNPNGDIDIKTGLSNAEVPKEAKIATGDLDDVVENGISFAWQNPHPYPAIVTDVFINLTTAATASPTMNVGLTTSATGTADTIMDGIDIGTAAARFDNINDKGTNGTAKPVKVDAKGGTNDYITGKVLDASGADLVGTYKIVYHVFD